MHIKLPRFFAIEGTDGTGKTTLCKALAQLGKKCGVDIVAVQSPGGTALGQKLRDILLSEEPISPQAQLHLFLADRLQVFREVVMPAAARGAYIFADRWILTTLTYQSQYLSLAEVRETVMASAVLDGISLVPSKTFILQAPISVSKERLAQQPEKLNHFDQFTEQEHARRTLVMQSEATRLLTEQQGLWYPIDSTESPHDALEDVLREALEKNDWHKIVTDPRFAKFEPRTVRPQWP